MINIKQYQQAFDKLITGEHKKASVYVIGSASQEAGAPFNIHLSDIDLMMIVQARSLGDLTDLITQAFGLNSQLNGQRDDAVELFVALPDTISFYLTYLSITAGIDQLDEKDRLSGEQFATGLIRSKVIARRMYLHAAIDLCREFAMKLPNADTKFARRTAKRVLRTLKIILCAQVPEEDFELIEARLLHVHNFEDLAEFLPRFNRQGMASIWQEVLDGKNVDDWPGWMKEQNDIAMVFADFAREFKYDVKEHQLYSALCRLRDLLIVDAKNVICENDEVRRGFLIGQYADSLAGVVAKLALLGIPGLKDLSTPETPTLVRDAYFKVLDHLQNERNNIECFTASIALGDYSLNQAIEYLTRDSKAEVL